MLRDDVLLEDVLRERVPVERLRVPVERDVVERRVLVLRPADPRVLRADARPPARPSVFAALRLADVDGVRRVVLRRVVLLPLEERLRVPVERLRVPVERLRVPVERLRVPVERDAVERRVPVERLRVPVERELVDRPVVLRPDVLRPVERLRLVERVPVELLRVPVERRVVLPLERRVPLVRFLVPSSSTPITSSNMCLLLLRDVLDDLACLLVLALTGDVGLGQDSDKTPVFLRDGQPADLVLSHQTQRFIQVLLRIDGHEIA